MLWSTFGFTTDLLLWCLERVPSSVCRGYQTELFNSEVLLSCDVGTTVTNSIEKTVKGRWVKKEGEGSHIGEVEIETLIPLLIIGVKLFLLFFFCPWEVLFLFLLVNKLSKKKSSKFFFFDSTVERHLACFFTFFPF